MYLFLYQRVFEKQTSFDKQLDSLTDLLSEMETRGPFNPKVSNKKSVGIPNKLEWANDLEGKLWHALIHRSHSVEKGMSRSGKKEGGKVGQWKQFGEMPAWLY